MLSCRPVILALGVLSLPFSMNDPLLDGGLMDVGRRVLSTARCKWAVAP